MKSSLLLFLIASSALAGEVENPSYLPFGEQEAFLGNTGIALEGSSGAVFYNPGALGWVNNRKISVYGNTYTFDNMRQSRAIAPDSPDLVMNSSAASSIPLSSVTVFGSEATTFAFSVNTPYSSRQERFIPYRNNQFDVRLSNDATETSLWIGPSFARALSENVSVGASIFAARYSHSANAISYQKDFTTNLVQTIGIRTSTNDWSALAVLGAHWRVDSKWSLGARIQTASLGIRGRSDYMITSQSSAPAASSLVESEQGIYSRFRRPFNLGIGSRFAPNARLSLLLDVHAQLPIHYNSAPSRPLINGRVERKFRPRANLGAHWRLSEDKSLMAGFLYNPSTLAKGVFSSGDFLRENIYGFSLGLQKDLGSLVSGLGGFYLRSKIDQSLPGVSSRVKISHSIVGVLLTASYKL